MQAQQHKLGALSMEHDFSTPEEFLAFVQGGNDRKSFFDTALGNPTFHWFFTQGQDALTQEFYIPGVLSLLNGIEASLRVTVRQIAPDYADKIELSNYEVLSNTLLAKAAEAGVPVDALAFPGEGAFMEKVVTKTPVEIVRLRNNICHGNILEFIQEVEPGLEILTPECLRPFAANLLDVAYTWAIALAKFRHEKGRRPQDWPIPNRPENPLSAYLPTSER